MKLGKVHKVALVLLAACGAPPKAPAVDHRELAAVHAHNETLITVQRATGRVKAALHRRDAAATGALRLPTPGACAALERAGGDVDAAWAAVLDAYAHLDARAVGRDGARGRAAQRARQARTQRGLDAAHREAWRARCASVPPVAPIEPPHEVTPGRLCRDLWRHEELLNLVAPKGWADRPHAALHVARRLSRNLDDELDVLLVLAHDGLRTTQVAAIDRGVPGLGSPAPYRAEHLPRWRRLEGVALLDAQRGLREAPTLYALARIHANRLPIDDCSPQLGGHWGYADVRGQLGGGGLEGDGEGTWLFSGGLVGNGGDVVPYAPLELYLLGLADPAEVGTVRFLRGALMAEDGSLRAAGTCTVDGPELVRRFGRRPRRDAPWRVGVVVVSATPITPDVARRYRADLAAVVASGPDQDPDRLNFYEATGGRGRLAVVVPSGRRAGCGPGAASLR